MTITRNNSLGQQDRNILGLTEPQKVEELIDYLLTSRQLSSTQEEIQEQVDEVEQKKNPTLDEAKEVLLTAINAISGTRKIIEQLYTKDNNPVQIDAHEKDLKLAVKRIFNQKTDVITYEMYKQAIEKRREIADQMKEKFIDAQAGDFFESSENQGIF